jgi:hypothetical protein
VHLQAMIRQRVTLFSLKARRGTGSGREDVRKDSDRARREVRFSWL